MTRLLFPAVLLVAVASVPVSHSLSAKEKEAKKPETKKAEPKKGSPEAIKWETAGFFKMLEKDFDLKVKTHSFVDGFEKDGEVVKGKYLRLLLVFTKNVDAKDWNARALPFNWGTTEDGPYIELYYFDDENVRILAQKHFNVIVDGDITRKKDEAFRVFVPLADDGILARTKRVEVYLRTGKKKTAKG